MRLGVLVSGTGSILEALLGRGLPVGLVAADRACRGLRIAADAGIETVLVGREDRMVDVAGPSGGAGAGGESGGSGRRQFDRCGYSCELAAVLAGRDVDVVAMAGFGTVLDGSFFEWGGGRYRGRVLNTHPSLLPAHPGWHAVRDALAAGAAESGCTVHVAIPEVDAGPVLAQRVVPVLAGDDEATLHERIKTVERELYPATIAAFLERCETDEVAVPVGGSTGGQAGGQERIQEGLTR
ncbi:phosphoribosylglycinamide formyltransferase [Candidatus Poriferisodalis sp.]|uniref:phosphoribosylglycinamide formyltransferase n=1 Tax=Candidatus Poriferisodalis sp. TaxID=3101277 RepID=UPI003B5AEDDA